MTVCERGSKGCSLDRQKRVALQVAIRLLSGSGMTTPMLATHSNRRFSCKGIFRVFPDVFFGAVFDPHNGSDDSDDVFIAMVFCFLHGI